MAAGDTLPIFNIDLNSWLKNYKDYTLLKRLYHVATTNEALAPTAIKLAINEITSNQEFQVEFFTSFMALAKSLNIPITNITNFNAEEAKSRGDVLLRKLETELTVARTELQKDNIRSCLIAIGRQYIACGDLSSALMQFAKSREVCTTIAHTVQMCMQVIEVCIHCQNYTQVANYSSRAEQSIAGASQTTPVDSITLSKIRASTGLTLLHEKKYRAAARAFLSCSFELGDTFNRVIHVQDIATYGGILSLATLSRLEIKTEVFEENPSFSRILELVPAIQALLQSFVDFSYTDTLTALCNIKSALSLDIYLAPHVDTLLEQIRSRVIIQFFNPYLSVKMSRMARELNTTVPALEAEVKELIETSQLAARIDSQHKILYARDDETSRHDIYESAVSLGATYVAETKAMLLRMNLVQNNIILCSTAASSTVAIEEQDENGDTAMDL